MRPSLALSAHGGRISSVRRDSQRALAGPAVTGRSAGIIESRAFSLTTAGGASRNVSTATSRSVSMPLISDRVGRARTRSIALRISCLDRVVEQQSMLTQPLVLAERDQPALAQPSSCPEGRTTTTSVPANRARAWVGPRPNAALYRCTIALEISSSGFAPPGPPAGRRESSLIGQTARVGLRWSRAARRRTGRAASRRSVTSPAARARRSRTSAADGRRSGCGR